MVNKTINEKIPPLKKRKLSKKAQGKEDEIKINLHIENQNLNDWKYQIHWNKLEWLNPRTCIEQKKIVCLLKKYV